MSDDKMKVDIGLDVHATGEDIIDVMTRKLDALNRKIKAINAGISSAARGISNPGKAQSQTSGTNAPKSARDALGFDRQAVTVLRQKLSLQGRLANQQARQEREALASFKARMSFQAKAEAQDVAAIRTRTNEEARAFRQRMSFTSRMGKLAIAEERRVASERSRSIADAARQEARRSRDVAASIRANARLEASESRRVDRERSSRESARSRGYSSIRQGAGDVREGASRAVRGAGALSAVATASTGAAIRRGVSTRMEIDSEETSLRIFSGQTQAQIVAARKTWLDNLSVTNGASIAEGIKTYGEVLKAGIKGAEQVTESIMKGAVGLELNVKETTKLAGLIDRNYGSASSPEKLKSALNAVAVAAREDPTQSNEIVEGVKRGFGALSTGNMTPEQLTALVSGGQSVGIQPGKAGTFVATQAKRMSEGASKFLGKKERKELDYAARELGFGNARSMAQAYARESYASIMSVNEKLAAMAPDKRAQVADALYGRQWSDEGLQMSQGVEGVKKTYGEITDSKNVNFLDDAARQRAQSLQGQWNSTKAIFGRFWDSFGSGFEDILTSIKGYFLDLNSSFDYDKIKEYVSEFMTGVREAFGVSTWKDLFAQAFGGGLGNFGADIRAFGRGLADGILSIGRVIRSIMTAFGGAGGGAETIGRLSGQFVALSVALVALAPVVSILGGLISIITGLVIAGRGLAGLAGLGAGAAVGAGAAGAGLMRGLGLALSRMFALSVVAEIGANRGVISTWMLDGARALLTAVVEGIKGAFTPESIRAAMKTIVSEMIPAPVQRWLESDGRLEEKKFLPGRVLDGIGKPPVPVAPTERGVLGKAWDWLTSSLVGSAHASETQGRPPAANASSTVKLTEAVNDNTAALQASFASPVTGIGGLIQRASITGTGSASAVRSSILDSAGQIRSGGIGSPSPVLSGSTAGGGFGPGPLAGSTPGSALGSGGGRLSPRGIIGGSSGSQSSSGGSAPAGTGGSRSWRNNNPGNIEFGPFAKSMGATRSDGRFAIFPDYQTGRKAQEKLLFESSGYKNLTLSQAIRRWAPASENNVPAYIAAMGGDRGTRMGDYSPDQRGKLLDAMQRHEGWREGTPATASARISGGVGSSVAASVADNASKLIGMGSSQAAQALGSRMTPGQWCADFVNGSLKSANIKGVNSSIATSFLGWGKEVTDGIRKGDVLVESRGRGIGQPGGHAGIATGETRQGPRGLQAEMVSGNHGNRVARSWTDMSKLTARRAITGETEDLAANIKANGWKPGAGGNAGALGSSSSAPLGENTPPRAINTISQNALSGGAAGGGGSSVHAPITIQGAGMDHEAIANAVQRKLNEKMNRRTNDLSPSSLSV